MQQIYPRPNPTFLAIRIVLVVSVLFVNSNGYPVRNDPGQIPEAPFKDGCRILINELRLDSQNPFLELARYCKNDYASIPNMIDIGKYAIIIMDQDEFVIGHCLLFEKQVTDGRWFYLIGDGANANFNIYNCQWESSLYDGSLLNLPQDTAFGVFLIKNERKSVLESFGLLKLGTKNIHRKISPTLSKVLAANLQDFYIFANQIMNENNLFENFGKYYSAYNSPNNHIVYMDFGADETLSISRCGIRSKQASFSYPFQPQLLKVTAMSPGRINECFHSQPPKKKARLNSDFPTLEACQTSTICAGPSSQPWDTEGDVISEEEFESKLENMPDYFWDQCEQFPNDKIKEIQQLPFNSVNIEDVLKQPVCTWIDYLTTEKKFVCKKCKILLKQKIIVDRKESPLITNIMKNGAIKLAKDEQNSAKARYENSKIISDHMSGTVHQISEQYFQLFSSGLRNQDLKQALLKEGGPYRNYLKATENVMLATIQSIRMNIPFNSFSIMAETLDYFGAHIGHLYRTPSGARMVSDIVGNKLHKDLISQLLKLDNDLSITLDSTTDIAGYGILGVIFQTFNETGHINSYLYRMMPLPKGEKGEQLFNQFMDSIRSDGLADYIKRKTVGLTTDGHPAVRKVFRRLLNNEIDNELVGVWCSAHVLELIATKAFELFPYLVEVDNFVNRIFRLLTAKSPLRREEFRNQIPLFGFRLFEFKRVRQLRWLGHHVRALSPFIFRYQVLVGTLETIAAERKYNLQTRQEAQDLLRQIKDSTFLATIAFTADILAILAELSSEYQRINNTPIGKKYMRDQLQSKLAALEHRYGEHVMFLIENSKNIRGQLYRNPLLTFESNKIEYNGIVLNDPDPIYEDYRLSSKMESYVDEILAQVEAYYPGDILDNFDFLYAKLFPAAISPMIEDTFGKSQLLQLNRKLKWNYDEHLLILEWRNLLISLLAHPDFPADRNKNPEDFWTKFLQANFVEWSPMTREIVKKALTIPASSAQPERLFSMYSYVKSYQRYNLLPATVENIVRIRFNPNKNIEEWNLAEFGKELILENHSRADDKSRRRTWKKSLEALEIVDEENLDVMLDEIRREEQDDDNNEDVDIFV